MWTGKRCHPIGSHPLRTWRARIGLWITGGIEMDAFMANHQKGRRVIVLPDDFFARVERSGDCWEWKGASAACGYGKVYLPYPGVRHGPYRKAHRVAYELQRGPIPDGLMVLHHCDNRRCVRGSHLFLGTNLDNMRDMAAKGRSAGAKKTHCPRGHPYDGSNLYIRPDGKRDCVTCRVEATRRWRRKCAVFS